MNPQRNVTSLRQELLLSLHVPSAADMHSTPNWVEDDILLPPQFFQPADRAHKMRGEVALLYAMLDDAVSCLQKGRLSRGHRAQGLAADAELWFFTDDYLSPFSFVNVCSLLGLDPAYLRSGLQQWRHQHQPRPQKKRRRTQVTRTPELAV